MNEYVEPNLLVYVERMETSAGVRWAGLLLRSDDQQEVWRSTMFEEEADALEAARDEFFNNTDR